MPSTLASQLRELVSLYSTHQRRVLVAHGLPPQVRLLILLHKLGPVTQSELGRVAGFEKSWISRLLDRFVEDGMVERIPLPNDRRSMQIHLTAAGVRHVTQVDALLASHAEKLLQGIAPDAQPRIAEALGLLTRALQQMPDSEGA